MLILESLQNLNENRKYKIPLKINFAFTNGHFFVKLCLRICKFKESYCLWEFSIFQVRI